MTTWGRTLERHIALQMIANGQVKSRPVSPRDDDGRRRLLTGGISFGGLLALALRQVVPSLLAIEHPGPRPMSHRRVELSELGRVTLAAWTAEFGPVEVPS